MSRIGRQPIPVPAGVTVAIEPERVRVNGPKGELSERIPRDIDGRRRTASELLVTRPTDRGEHRALHGLTRSLVANMVRASPTATRSAWRSRASATARSCKGKNLELARRLLAPGADHGARRDRVRGARSRRAIVVKGISKQLVGETAAIIRKQRPPEPYKGKGIRYEGEYVARKVGKRA